MGSKYTKTSPYVPQCKFHISMGNTKIGKILNTNLLAGDDDVNGRVTIKGSCNGCCETCKHVCYARKAYRYDAALKANADNLYYARTENLSFFNDVVTELNRHKKFKDHRWHSSGEIPYYMYLELMDKVARKTPGYNHYVYTKRYDWVNQYFKSNIKPDNLTILFSPPFTCDTWDKIKDWSEKNNPNGLPMFIYDNGKDPEIGKLSHCPAVDKNGRKTGVTCDKCRRCIKGMTTAVYAH